MYTPIYTTQFAKDVKRMQRRRKDMEKLKMILRTLLRGTTPDPIHRDHKLIGDYDGRRACHLEADWVLVYKVEARSIVFERTGTHADLFRK